MTAHPIDTEALRRLTDQATPGPWEAEAANGGVFHVAVHPYPEGSVALDAKQADAAFIAAARTAVPALLGALAAAEHRATRAEERIKALRDVLDVADSRVAYDTRYAVTSNRMNTIVNGADIRRALDEEDA